MVKPGLRSRTFRRVFVKATKGARIHYKNRKETKAKCRLCDKALLGVSQGTRYQMNKTSKSMRVPSRMFGGNLCSKCSRQTLVQRAMVIRNG